MFSPDRFQLGKLYRYARSYDEGLVKTYRGGAGVGRSRDGVGHEVLSLVQGVGRVIFSYP